MFVTMGEIVAFLVEWALARQCVAPNYLPYALNLLLVTTSVGDHGKGMRRSR